MKKFQFHITCNSIAEDRLAVDRVLMSCGEIFSLLDTTVTSRVPETVRCFSEWFGGGSFVGARVSGNIIVIDLSPGREESPRYPEIEQNLISGLRGVFGDRLRIPRDSEVIVAVHTLSTSKEGREFAERHLFHKPDA